MTVLAGLSSEAEALAALVPAEGAADIGTRQFRDNLSALSAISIQTAGADVIIKPAAIESQQPPLLVTPAYVSAAREWLDTNSLPLLFVTARNPRSDKARYQEAAARVVHLNLVQLAVRLIAEAGNPATRSDPQFIAASQDILALDPSNGEPIYSPEDILGETTGSNDTLTIFRTSLVACREGVMASPFDDEEMPIGVYFGHGQVEAALDRMITPRQTGDQSQLSLAAALSRSKEPGTPPAARTGETVSKKPALGLFLTYFPTVNSLPPSFKNTFGIESGGQRRYIPKIDAILNRLEGQDDEIQKFSHLAIRSYVEETAIRHLDKPLLQQVAAILGRESSSPIDIVGLSNHIMGGMRTKRGEDPRPRSLESGNIQPAFRDLRRIVQWIGTENKRLVTLGNVVQIVLGKTFPEIHTLA